MTQEYLAWNTISKGTMVEFIMPCHKVEFVVFYELDKAKGRCVGSFKLKFPLKEECGNEESSNWVPCMQIIKTWRCVVLVL